MRISRRMTLLVKISNSQISNFISRNFKIGASLQSFVLLKSLSRQNDQNLSKLWQAMI